LYHTYNDRDVSMQGHCVSGRIDLGDQGSQNIRTGTYHFGTFRHPTFEIISHKLQKFQEEQSLQSKAPWSLNLCQNSRSIDNST